MNDSIYMQKCFDLALKGKGTASPNPLVGSVIVKEGQIISEGFHLRPGLAHAELDAIQNAKESIKGATLYCNLEPCCHTNKRTPPCAQRIIKEGFSKVVISNLDPNQEVAGKGVKLLQEAGIEVIVGVEKEKGLEINEIFFHHIINQRPFVHLKMAQTLDGKLATKTMDSKWITNDESRLHVHQQRLGYDAILVGANTLKKDNPSLTIRIPGQDELPLKRIILSTKGDLPFEAKVFNDQFKELTTVILPKSLEGNHPFKTIYCELLENGEFNLRELLSLLYNELSITSLYVEGGQRVHTSFIHQQLYDRISVYIAPKILGEGYNTIGDLGHELMQNALTYVDKKWKQFGDDIMFTARRL